MKNIIFYSLIFILLNACKKENPEPGNTDIPCTPNEAELSLAADLSDHYAYRIESDDPAVEAPELEPLLDYLATAKIVGLGESTHGTAEFFRMKDKLFRQLVRKKNFKAIIFEIPWGNALLVNDFVTKGIGSADASVDQTFYWVYDTEEVRALAQWIHDFNQNLPEEERILFVGCDPQGGDFQQEKNIVLNFVDTVEPDSVFAVLGHYTYLPSEDLNNYKDADSEIHLANIAGTQAVYDFLEANRESFITATSTFDFEIALMAAHVIQQREKMYRIQNFGWLRDELMATYSEWWQRILGDDAKVAVWAHNAHVMDAAYFNADWMGTFLRQWLGDDYKNVGFSLGKGSFNAFLAGADRSFISGVQIQYIPEATCRTANQVLTLVEGDQHYLIFEELEGEAKNYFYSPQSFVQLGAGFNYTYLHNYTQEYSLAELFDVFIHFDSTNASVLQ